jgi:hypothetical protein
MQYIKKWFEESCLINLVSGSLHVAQRRLLHIVEYLKDIFILMTEDLQGRVESSRTITVGRDVYCK